MKKALIDLNIIIDMLNKSKGDVAYTLVDVDQEASEDTLEKIRAVDGILGVRAI